MIDDGLTDEESALVLLVMLATLAMADTRPRLRVWGEENAGAAKRLTELDRGVLRAAYVARRDEMGA